MIASTPTSAAAPPTGPISSRTIWPSALAVAAQRADQDREVLHRAAEHDADQDVERAGQVAELRGEDRARPAGPGPAIAAKWWPNTTQRLVGTKSLPSRRRCAGVGARVVEREARARRGSAE